MADSNPLTSLSSNKNGTRTPTLLQLNDYKLPVEIISHIISFFVPDAGLCISNDPEYDADLDTVRALLKTSLNIKHEALQLIFRKPLNVYITSGKRCGCSGTLYESTLISDFHPLKRLVFLPLVKWKEVRVCFAPKESRLLPCPVELASRGSWSHVHNGFYSAELVKAARCVSRQSNGLAVDMWRLRTSIPRTGAVNFKFVFEKLQGASPWHIHMVQNVLRFWEWTMADQSSMDPAPLELPEFIYANIHRDALHYYVRRNPIIDPVRHACLQLQRIFQQRIYGWQRRSIGDDSLEEDARGLSARVGAVPKIFSGEVIMRINIPRTKTNRDVLASKWSAEVVQEVVLQTG
ncbi:uncharacterized protein Z520_08806 [Fonsecaea multimorphosa CBS 102226]|uniref:F-box domain-containing protein n=1 Tax=Fonsecaea multimorphosa CBS 102226 TaxID=1442371 RepID=A0A0D2JXN7_9EURO|nr:uncharacterized protein Z520_08806 [Fonsecaea multimorphosa CBS 102226]KIX95289.1 hypothetical protein Z520_08806 [Fonsecaea multimorphosa CBS 102226]OAL21090.1 hypothetical protein AYO22_08247 [Fonsecaea multimorphosa]